MAHYIAPDIHTENTLLTQLKKEHAADIFNFSSDEQVAKTAIWDAHLNLGDSVKYIDDVQKRLSTVDKSIFLSWAVKDIGTNKVIGLVSLNQLGAIRAQIGYVFHYQHCNTKLPVECISALITFSFEISPQLERLQSRCFPTNHSSVSLLEKIGFQNEGVNHAMVKVRNQVQDLSCFSMTRKRWAAIEEFGFFHNDILEHI